MIIIPGFLVSLLTFPGVIVHEFAHKLICQLTGTVVHAVKYFQLGNPAGYVIHERPNSIWKHMAIGVGPVLVNTLGGLVVGSLAVLLNAPLISIALAWLGVSIAKHAFPSTGDARSIWDGLRAKDTPLAAKIIGMPLIGLIYLGAIASVFWVDFVFAVIVALVIPRTLFGA
jgi:hypothetical protein